MLAFYPALVFDSFVALDDLGFTENFEGMGFFIFSSYVVESFEIIKLKIYVHLAPL